MNNAAMVQQHPLAVMERIVACCGSELVFTYSRYEVAPPGLQAAARRTPVLRVFARDLTSDWLTDRLAELEPNEEMAWHSWVESKSLGFHIPMIDFLDQPDQSTLHDLAIIISEIGFQGSFVFFDTGRSFHGYFPGLIAERMWPDYLGRLLLVNRPNHSPTVDTRWVGHALVRRFAALRWSHNTTRYLAMPRCVTLPFADVSQDSRQDSIDLKEDLLNH